MPRTIQEGFEGLLEKLKPHFNESQAAKNHRASIEASLKYNFGLNRFVRIGSFGNHTSISGYSDVDYLACLPKGQFAANSSTTLTKVRDALNTRFPQTGVAVNCPAVAVPFGTRASERTEIVPADYISEGNSFKVYDIADCSGGWMRSSPDAHNAYVRMIDGRLEGKVKPLIRFLKAWKFFKGVPISSFYLEMRVAKWASTETSILYESDVRTLLRILWDGQLASVQDPMGVSGLIPACKSNWQRTEALSRLGTALTRANKAREASGDNNVSLAFDWWRLIYDNKFPTYYY